MFDGRFVIFYHYFGAEVDDTPSTAHHLVHAWEKKMFWPAVRCLL